MATNTIVNFPNGLEPKSVKDSPEYGKQVASAILGVTLTHRQALSKTISESRKYAEGNQDISQYLDELEIDGKKMYANMSYRARPIAPKFKSVVVNGYLMRNEYPSAIATSKDIQERKDRKKSDAQFRMEYGDKLGQISQQAGLPLIDQSEFTPTSKEELDVYSALNDKEHEELLMQKMISFALKDNDIEAMKNHILDEQFVAQYHGLYNYIDDNGRLVVDTVMAEDIICDNSRFEDTHDAEFKGRYIRTTISSVRRKYALKPEQERALFSCAKDCMGRFGNPSRTFSWSEDYRNANSRPYDDYTIEILHIWWKTSKVMSYVEGKDRYGREVFDIDYSLPLKQEKSDGRKKVGYKYPQTAYEGFFTSDASICLEWGEQKNILRKGEDKEELLCPFIFFMPMNKGRMLPKSLMTFLIDSVRNMDIAVLKIKQLIAKSTPDDYIIDIDGLMNLDLGNGEELQPLDIMQIHQQTGRLYWSSKGENGMPTNQPPIRANQNAIDAKMNVFITQYNQELSNIRDYLGVNEFRDGSAAAPRTGFKFMQAQNEASNTATWFIYRAYYKSVGELIRQIGIRIWDALNYGDVNKGYLKYLGKENVEFIQKRKEITASSYDIEFSLGISDEDKATLEQYINTALSAGNLEIPDAIKINNIKDPIQAEKVLAYLYEKRRKQKQEEAQQNQKSAADYSAQAGVAVEQAKQQTAQITMQAEAAKEEAKNNGAQILAMMNGALTLITESFKTGQPIPDAYAPLVQMAIQNATLKTQQSADITHQQIEQQVDAEQKQQVADQLQQGVKSGEISEDEATKIAQEQGLM